ncbi:CsbD family protein [Alcaligenes sp. Marseille-Q7550]
MNKDTIEGKWKQLAGKAKSVWGDLTDDELARVKGDSQQLAGLVQERYGRTREEAEREVKDFYDKYDRY